MSKTFTAVLVMRRVERGDLNLNAKLSRFFPRRFVQKIHPDAQRITLEHLLNHTAGLWDFALSREWFDEIRGDLGAYRDPQAILAWAVEHGRPVGGVGERHVYSDTGYVLLGRLLELTSGQSYAKLCRDEILDPLGMKTTWLEGHEEPRSNLSHAYAGRDDALQIHGSVDWAAGGHVSNVDDLVRFVRGLFRDHALIGPPALDQMLTTVPTQQHRYGLGVGVRYEKASRNPAERQTLWGHSGHWGSFMFYLPAWRASIAGTVNRSGQDNRWIFENVVEILRPRR